MNNGILHFSRRTVSARKIKGGIYLLTVEPNLHGPHVLHVLVNGQAIHVSD